MGFTVETGISAVTVFVQGILSFFSPCVFPLIPLYLGYLSGTAAGKEEEGQNSFSRGRAIVNTCFFVLGISFAFFLLGFSMTAVGRFFHGYQSWFVAVGGVIVILFGLFQMGVFGNILFLNRERRLPFNVQKMTMSPLTALLMGFTFSFAWTPCVGPTLSSVLLMAASSAESSTGYLLIAVYTIGFVLPFLIVGLFTSTVLAFFQKHRNVVRYMQKIGGVLMIFMGILMLTGRMNGISAYFSGSGTNASVEEGSVSKDQDEESEADSAEAFPAPDFTLTDQYGVEHTLSDYQGKVVFLNFWATWCPPCRAEMPDIQALFEEYQKEEDPEVVFLGVAFPGYGNELDEDGVKSFLSENGYTYPVVMDSGADLIWAYYISAYPTTFMIDRDGNLFGYVTGSMDRHVMQSIIDQTLAGKK